MPTHQFQTPEGHVYEIEAPENATPDEVHTIASSLLGPYLIPVSPGDKDRDLPARRRLPQISPEVLFPSGDTDRAPMLSEWVNWDPTGQNPGHSFGPRMRLQDLPRDKRTHLLYEDPTVTVFTREQEIERHLPPGLQVSIFADGEQTDFTKKPASSGARGMGELMPTNRVKYRDSDPDDPLSSITAGARMLADRPFNDRYLGTMAQNPERALISAAAYYNGGYHGGDAVLGDKLPPKLETRQYDERVRTGMAGRTRAAPPVCFVPPAAPLIPAPLGLTPTR